MATAGQGTFISMGDYEGKLYFGNLDQRHKNFVRSQAAEAFKLACGLQEYEKARLLSDILILIMPEIDTFTMLIISALEAESIHEASKLANSFEDKAKLAQELRKYLDTNDKEIDEALKVLVNQFLETELPSNKLG